MEISPQALQGRLWIKISSTLLFLFAQESRPPLSEVQSDAGHDVTAERIVHNVPTKYIYMSKRVYKSNLCILRKNVTKKHMKNYNDKIQKRPLRSIYNQNKTYYTLIQKKIMVLRVTHDNCNKPFYA